jgi:hypothetical protein
MRLDPFSLSLSVTLAVASHQSSYAKEKKKEYMCTLKSVKTRERDFAVHRREERERARPKPTTNGRIWVNDV